MKIGIHFYHNECQRSENVMFHLHPQSETGKSQPPSSFGFRCWTWWRPCTSSWCHFPASSRLICYWWSSCSYNHCMYTFYSCYSGTLDVPSHHTCIIPYTFNTYFHRFCHPHLSPFPFLESPCENDDPSNVGIWVQISCCIFPGDVEFVYETWGIDYLHWWNLFVCPPSIWCADFRSVFVAHRKGSTTQSLCAQLLDDILCMSQNPMNVSLVLHIPEAHCVDESL